MSAHNHVSAGSAELAARLRAQIGNDHARGCAGRQYMCDCGYDLSTEGLLEMAADEIERLRKLCEMRVDHVERLLGGVKVIPDAAQAAWNPIETTPRDGMDIIVYRPKFDGDYIPRVGTDYWMTRGVLVPTWARSRKDCQPTHWMHFPEPPK